MPQNQSCNDLAMRQWTAARDYFDNHVEGLLGRCFPEVLAEGLVLWGSGAPLAWLDGLSECCGWVTHPTFSRARRLRQVNAVLAEQLPTVEWTPGRPLRFQAIAPAQAGLLDGQVTLADLDREALWRLAQSRPLHDLLGYVARFHQWLEQLPEGAWGLWSRRVWGQQLGCHQGYLEAREADNALSQCTALAGFIETMLENAFLLSRELAPSREWLSIEASNSDDHRRTAFEQMLLLSRQPDQLLTAQAALENAAGLFGSPNNGAQVVLSERWQIPYARSPADGEATWCWYALADCHGQWRLHLLREDELGAFLAMGRWLYWALRLERSLQPIGWARTRGHNSPQQAPLGFFIQQALAETDWRARHHWAGLAIEKQIAPALWESQQVEEHHLSFPQGIVAESLDRAADDDGFWP